MNAVEKTLAVIGALASHDRPRSLADIAQRTGVNKTTVHRILQIFIAQGYAVTKGDGTYASGPAMLALAGAALTDGDMTALVRPILANLQRHTSHTVHFAVRSETAAVYLAKVESQQPYRMASRVGTQIALHSTAIGKAILAHLPQEEVRAVIAATSPLIRNTAATIVDPALLLQELEAVRERGYAIDDEENETNVRCVGAAVRDGSGTAVGAVSVAGLTLNLSKDDVPLLGPLVVAAAARVSAAIGRNG
ncbi:IclR family transcriptional regulator [Nonomuraea rhizosphaerae]|uniref:IclR family transcriptional regulator n=1 Tax=Nonomuraea rhizosphaerae TaxID=2665663 RepID=UPI001C5DAB3D|nr:IclR family transcriptional regulator [Nonomuraea rhizosphaerae]